jgi:tRNA dimethylallyltransferase
MAIKRKNMRPKIITIVAPTASGKTEMAIKLAKEYHGEIINADSRQIYCELNIGTAKPVGEWQIVDGVEAYFVDGVAHHLMDFISPDADFSVADFKDLAEQKIEEILSRGKLPILVGGTGLYVSAITDNLDIPRVPANKILREELEKLSLLDLQKRLKKIDPKTFTVIDQNNPRRLVRAVEVAETTGQSFFAQQKKGISKYDILALGITVDREELYRRIDVRVDEQIKNGLVEEVINLAKKYSWELPSMSSIGYRQIGYFLRGEMSLPEAVEILKRDTRRYAKRQITWFKRDKNIKWVKGEGEVEVFFVAS